MNAPKTDARLAALAPLARKLGFETLAERGADSLDFREVGVVRLREALEAAYEAGARAAREGAK